MPHRTSTTKHFAPANGAPSHPRHPADVLPNHPPSSASAAAPIAMNAAPGVRGGGQGDMSAFPPSALPRSPPKNKSEYIRPQWDGPRKTAARQALATDTQHVPCKFFLQGQCQAGRMCPFSHDVESSTRPAPCKYFAKGGCKFGRKCALLHITQDGTVVNHGPRFGPAPPQFQSAQLPPPTYVPHPPGLLSIQAQGLEPASNGHAPQDFDPYQYSARNGAEYPPVDLAYTSASPTYGSPQQENYFPSSPPSRTRPVGLSVLDAPLPNSFDSNGISMAARNGPFAASMPGRFGIESPPASLPRKAQLGNTALRDLHSSAFGGRGMDGVLAGSSPPSGPDEPLTFPKRPLHSDRFADRYQMMSASLGTRLPTQSFEYSDEEDIDTDADADHENNLLPASLRELIPEGRPQAPRSRGDESSNSAANFLAAQRRTISGHGTPQDSKVGSPFSSSPSRFSSLFHRNQNGRTDESHVGSPLRNSGFAYSDSTSRTPSAGDLSPTVGSPPRQASMSVLTQELQRTKLDAARSQAAAAAAAAAAPTAPGSTNTGAANLAPGISRTLSNGSTPTSTPRTSLERAVSGTATVTRDRIDEEPDLFDMDEVGAPPRSAPRAIPLSSNNNNQNNTASNNNNSSSTAAKGAWGSTSNSARALFASTSPGGAGPTFGAIGAHRTPK